MMHQAARQTSSSTSRKSSSSSSKSKHPSDKAPDPPSSNDEEQPYDQTFECNICLDTAKDAVVSMCGHLFCWPCLHQWLTLVPTTDTESQNHKTCPVCKAAISRDKVIPIYGRGGGQSSKQDPRDKLPPRPAGQRTEVPYNPNHFIYGNVWTPGGQIFGYGDGGFHMSFGVGLLPQYVISYICAILYELWPTNDGATTANDPSYFFMRSFLIIGFLILFFTVAYV